MRHRPTHHRSRKSRRAVVALTALLVAVAGCGDSSDDADTTDDPPVASEASDDTTADTTAATDAAAVATTEDTTSSGPVTASIATVPGWDSIVEPILAGVAASSAADVSFTLDDDWMDANAGEEVEQRLVEAVASGELDAALVGVRGLATLGVPGFDVLVAPGLVDSYELQEAVLASDVPDRLLPALDSVGVVGVAMVPGWLRYPIGVDRPFVAPDDFEGATFHTFPARINAATAAALGATHSQVWGEERDAGIDDGTIDLTENGVEWMRNNGRGSHLTFDALWPATGVLIMNPDLVAEMSTSQIDAVAAAVASSSSTAAEFVAAESELVAEVCEAGKQFVVSSTDDRTAMLDALRPVYDALAADATTGPLLDELRAIKETVASTRPTLPESCDGSAEETAAVGSDDPSVLNGAYQLEWTVEELIDVTGIDERTARKNDGVFVLTFADGTFDMFFEQDPDAPCRGTYGVSGDRVQLVAASDLSEWTCDGASLGATIVDAAWRLDGDQLVLSDFVLSDRPDITWWNAGYLSKPLTRVE